MKFPVRKQHLAVIGLLWGWCLMLIGYYLYKLPYGLGRGLIWNLFLATIPLLWSYGFQSFTQKGRPLLAAISFLLWLLFLPNAPYLLTDLIHMEEGLPDVPQWYILAMLLFCAGTGTFLGYVSLLQIHAVIEQKFGKVTGWGVATASLLLCSFGIYIGRFLRVNSWETFTQPLHLLRTIIDPFINPHLYPPPFIVTAIFGIGLIIGYLALRVMTASDPVTPES